MSKRFNTIALADEWKDAIGEPELTGSWFVYGPPKNGKTGFSMKLAKMLASLARIVYNSVEEGLSLSIRAAMNRAGMEDAGSRFVLAEMDFKELKEFLGKKRSPDIIFIDSVQFMELQFGEYKQLKSMFPSKLFVYISHVSGNVPDGQVARKIWRDANVVFRIEGFKAFPVGRYGGGTPIVISKERANKYWGV
ncbi:MAG: ATP-dependent serine protease [Bacteroidales bacterium]|jgi:hypothetical protein|nr:ATP-dependent serine protease [Bacteroidales bacterium]